MPIINPLYEKTGTDHGSHIGHRTRHGAPARGRKIRHNGDGTPRRTARNAPPRNRSGGRPLHRARLRRAQRSGGPQIPKPPRTGGPAHQQRRTGGRAGTHRPRRHGRLGRHDRHQRQGTALRHAGRHAQNGRRGRRPRIQHRLDRRHRSLRKRRGLLPCAPTCSPTASR